MAPPIEQVSLRRFVATARISVHSPVVHPRFSFHQWSEISAQPALTPFQLLSLTYHLPAPLSDSIVEKEVTSFGGCSMCEKAKAGVI
jgi:hypothetical protein